MAPKPPPPPTHHDPEIQREIRSHLANAASLTVKAAAPHLNSTETAAIVERLLQGMTTLVDEKVSAGLSDACGGSTPPTTSHHDRTQSPPTNQSPLTNRSTDYSHPGAKTKEGAQQDADPKAKESADAAEAHAKSVAEREAEAAEASRGP